MSTLSLSQATPALRFETLNWLASTVMPRDQTQSPRLHEPEHPIITTINPAYQDTPINHPNPQLPYPATDNDDRGG